MIHHLQHFEILVKCVKLEHFNGIFLKHFSNFKYLFVFKNISENYNCNVAMKYFAILGKNVETIFHLQLKIENIF